MHRLAITGPESTGKTTLARALADDLPHAVWVPEYARTYLAALPNPADYTPADLEAIAQGQLAAEATASIGLPGHGWLVCDTDLLVILIWAEERFGQAPAWLRTAALNPAAYHYRLLLRPDLPWQPDPLREHPAPAARTYLFERYRDTLLAAGLPFIEVGGIGPNRVAAALRALGLDSSG